MHMLRNVEVSLEVDKSRNTCLLIEENVLKSNTLKDIYNSLVINLIRPVLSNAPPSLMNLSGKKT